MIWRKSKKCKCNYLMKKLKKLWTTSKKMKYWTILRRGLFSNKDIYGKEIKQI